MTRPSIERLVRSVRAQVERASVDSSALLEALASIDALGRVLDVDAGPRERDSGRPLRSVPVRSVPVRLVPVRSVPVRSVPARSVSAEATSIGKVLGLSRLEAQSLIARGRRLFDERDAVKPGTSDAAFAERHARALARRGLDRLEGTNAPLSVAPLSMAPLSVAGTAGARRVPEATVLRLLRGELDGFRAAEVAYELTRSAAGCDELAWLLGATSEVKTSSEVETTGMAPLGSAADGPLRSAADGPLRSAADGPLRSAADGPLRLAADGPSPMRDPSTGEVIGRFGNEEGTLELEAVRFSDGLVAIYASAARTLTLEGPKKTKVVVAGGAPGYLELRLPKGTRAVRVRVEGIDLDL